MTTYNTTTHQQAQIEVINKIEQQANTNSMQFSTVTPVNDYTNDTRISLTGVHLPNDSLKKNVSTQILEPLRKVDPTHHYYQPDTLHLTIKNVRLISDPPAFDDEDISKVKNVFKDVIPHHHAFKAYFYRLLLFPANLTLIGTTEPELDLIHLDLDRRLNEVGISDDKQYVNSRYFFCNMTLVRFTSSITNEYMDKIEEISRSIICKPYKIDSVTLLTCNATLNKQQIIDTWSLT